MRLQQTEVVVATVPTPLAGGSADGAENGLVERLISRRAAVLLVRNTVVSCFVFALGLALLWVLVEMFAIDKVLAAGVAFLVSNSLHYLLGRAWIYRGTERRIASGYAYFLINAGVGLAITVLLFAALIAWTPLHYLLARVIVSLFAGLAMFVLNAVLNFRSI